MHSQQTPLLQEAKSAMEESRSLRTRIHLADAAQKQARGMEMDYEEVIHLLEAEIAEMKSQKSEQPGQGKVFHFESFTLSLTFSFTIHIPCIVPLRVFPLSCTTKSRSLFDLYYSVTGLMCCEGFNMILQGDVG